MDKFWTMDSGVFRALDFTQPLPVWKVAISTLTQSIAEKQCLFSDR